MLFYIIFIYLVLRTLFCIHKFHEIARKNFHFPYLTLADMKTWEKEIEVYTLDANLEK